jgi:hypothetical protein
MTDALETLCFLHSNTTGTISRSSATIANPQLHSLY